MSPAPRPGSREKRGLLEYSVTFTKALGQQLIPKGICVNAVAPDSVWTPLNPAGPGFPPDKVEQLGATQPMKRTDQPEEIAPACVFLASDADSACITGIVLREMGGQTTGG